MKPMIYLACPYGHPDRDLMDDRYETANKVTAKLMAEGNIIFSPLSHTVPISKYLLDWKQHQWLETDLPFMEMCDELYVLMLHGWKESKGVEFEIHHFTMRECPISYIEYDAYTDHLYMDCRPM